MPTFDIANRLASIWQERVTQAPKFIDTDHAYIHEGIAFDAFWTGAINDTTGHFQFTTPAAKYVHFRPANVGIDAGIATLRVFAANVAASAAHVTGGSTFTPVNRKHTSTTAATVTFNTSVDTSSTGDFVLKYQTRIYGGTGPGQSRIGQSRGEPLEWIFTPSRDYIITVTTTAVTNVTLNLFWYEEDNA